MKIPVSLQSRIETAMRAMLDHPEHDLSLGYRHALYVALDIGHSAKRAPNRLGHRRRAILAILTVRHVLPIWEQVWPADNVPHFLLYAAEQVLHGRDAQTVTQDPLVAALEYHADELARQFGWQPAVEVARSAVAALGAVLRDERFNRDQINTTLTDADVEPWERDTAFSAAVAAAGGAPWQSASNAVQRRRFWEWWLREAMPAAWHESLPAAPTIAEKARAFVNLANQRVLFQSTERTIRRLCHCSERYADVELLVGLRLDLFVARENHAGIITVSADPPVFDPLNSIEDELDSVLHEGIVGGINVQQAQSFEIDVSILTCRVSVSLNTLTQQEREHLGICLEETVRELVAHLFGTQVLEHFEDRVSRTTA